MNNKSFKENKIKHCSQYSNCRFCFIRQRSFGVQVLAPQGYPIFESRKENLAFSKLRENILDWDSQPENGCDQFQRVCHESVYFAMVQRERLWTCLESLALLDSAIC